MDLSLLRRRRRSLLLLAAGAASAYSLYRLYHHPSVVAKRQRFSKLIEILASLADALSSSADSLALVSSDLNRFLRSNSDEIPTSLKQVSKIATSGEVTASISKFSEALTIGIVRGVGSNPGPQSNFDFTNRILDKLMSPSGSGFASVVVGSFARNLVVGFNSNGSNLDSSWIQMVCTDPKCKDLIAGCVQVFVRSAIEVYLEKTMDVNAYDEFFAGITNPQHEGKLKELVVEVCNGAVETLVKTSHQVLTSSSGNGVELGEKEDKMVVRNGKDEEKNGWFDQVSTTLAVPGNRRFVLDVTGRVTFETVRSFLDFLLWKLYDGAKRSVSSVREGVVEKGVEVVRYFSAKSMLVVTICLALCMRVMAGTRVLMPA